MRFTRFAALFLLATALSAQAYLFDINGSGNARHWELVVPNGSVHTNVVNPSTHAIRYFIASNAFSPANTTAELNAVRASFAQWQSIPGTHLKFEDAGLVSPPVDINTSDNKNLVYWTTSSFVNGGMDNIGGALGVTFSRFSGTGNVMLESDIVFNAVGTNSWFTDFFDPENPDFFVEGVALHEIGHFIGLEHTPSGGTTMFYTGSPGLSPQAGLSSDEVAAARALYPTAATNYGTVKGTITKNGSPVFGAAVFARDAAGNTVEGTVTAANGTYRMNSLTPGTYQLRAAPLDDKNAADYLCRGSGISLAYTNADTVFLPTTNKSTSVAANVTNTVDFSVTAGTPAFRITFIRLPSTDAFSYAWNPLAVSLRAGQSNYFIGVISADLPTSNATVTITGDGLTLGPPSFDPNLGGLGLNFISVSISVASNATPGLRDFIVQQGANVAYASGFFEVKPTVTDDNFDGLDDSFQRQYFPLFTATNATPNADPDGDQMNNFAENIAGTVPTNAASVLKMSSVARTNSTATIRWLSVNGKKYQVSYRTNLSSGNWSNVGAVVTAASTTAQLADPTATNGFRAYRVQVLP